MTRPPTTAPPPHPSAPARPVTDAQRQQAADLVVEAAGAGALELPEADTQLAAAYRAETEHDLAAVRAQLPAGWLERRGAQQRAAAAQQLARQALRWHLAAYVVGMTVMVGIWLAVGLAAGAWYPWPIWPALGWGIGVHSHARAAAGGSRGRRGCGASRALPQVPAQV